MATLNFGPVTLPLGTRVFGPAALADSDTKALLTIDRTVTGGLNATAAARITIDVEQSNDAGATWQQLASGDIRGGTIIIHGGATDTSDDVGMNLWPGTGRQARATVTVSGAAVAVQGSLAIT